MDILTSWFGRRRRLPCVTVPAASPVIGPWNYTSLLLLSASFLLGTDDALRSGHLKDAGRRAQAASTSCQSADLSSIAVTGPPKKAALAESHQSEHIRMSAVPVLGRLTFPQPRLGAEDGCHSRTNCRFQETFLVSAIDAALAAANATKTPLPRLNRSACPVFISLRLAEHAAVVARVVACRPWLLAFLVCVGRLFRRRGDRGEAQAAAGRDRAFVRIYDRRASNPPVSYDGCSRFSRAPWQCGWTTLD